ncbi:hypothetical protein K461DRAFT_276962, partial [Myriangium duriaei CBS 260.36]
MYQSFTGSSRRPRQVDLSGRKANPWSIGPQPGTQTALQNAQHDRQLRQRQRQELAAAKIVQRVWRGYTVRSSCRRAWREEWDKTYFADGASIPSQPTAQDCVELLVLFALPADDGDVQRMIWVGDQLRKSTQKQDRCTEDAGWWAYHRFGKLCLRAMRRLITQRSPPTAILMGLLNCIDLVVVTDLDKHTFVADLLYQMITNAYEDCPEIRSQLLELLRGSILRADETVYEALSTEILGKPQALEVLDVLVNAVDRSRLIKGTATVSHKFTPDARRALWLLGNLIHVITTKPLASRSSPGNSYGSNSGSSIQLMGQLLGAVAEVIDVEATPLELDNYQFDKNVLSSSSTRTPLNPFLQRALRNLIDQDTVRRVLVEFQNSDDDASTYLATYVLTLLRVFYQHSDDIRMWLYLGPSDHSSSQQITSPIGFFWKAARTSTVVQSIVKDPRAATALIINKASVSAYQPPSSNLRLEAAIINDWKVVLIFLELYTFVLKLMDDEEFLGQNLQNGRSRINPLSLSDVADLVIFLKHLGFAMYYYAQQISDAFSSNQTSLSRQNLNRAFGVVPDPEEVEHPDPQPITVAGLPGIGLEYVKGIVTGLVRSIYERDSRRRFLPKGHWLMTSEFDMSNFISDVVAEEENRHQVEDGDENDMFESDDDSDWRVINAMNSNLRRIRDTEKRQRALKKASRRRYLESVAPRLEILQHMPFLIPFDTRVAIFREFVRLDQSKRRNGFIDPDIWRQTLIAGRTRFEAERELNRHHAKIRRKHEFRDSMDQFWDLGASLKEPIQITFVDEFDMVEAGIDGGGVTKEFLTSATANAFSPEYGLFKSTDQHLLYPNPTAMEELRRKFDDSEVYLIGDVFEDHVRWMLNEYEYAGRIIGKCLYEGILVDISFAGFFLNKWATAGSTSSNSQESAYRTNINDLRDLDEELYQGLLSLKNYEGNAEDMALTFSITDEIPVANGGTKAVDRDLIPGGSNIPVTNENKLIYISRVARYRLQVQSFRQSNAFLKGLSSIIQPSWLAMFNQSELQNLVGGAASSINVEDLRRNTIYGGLYVIGDDGQEHPSVQLFWRVMHELSDEEKGKVLKFVTSTPRAPLLGFGSLTPKFSIRDSGTDEARFPTTSTCINLLKLPRYSSKEGLREKLLYAVNSGAGFDL